MHSSPAFGGNSTKGQAFLPQPTLNAALRARFTLPRSVRTNRAMELFVRPRVAHLGREGPQGPRGSPRL